MFSTQVWMCLYLDINFNCCSKFGQIHTHKKPTWLLWSFSGFPHRFPLWRGGGHPRGIWQKTRLFPDFFTPSLNKWYWWCWCCWYHWYYWCGWCCWWRLWNDLKEDLLSQDNLVRFHLLTILTRQGHISKVVVLFQISKSSTLSLMLADFFIWKIWEAPPKHNLSQGRSWKN